MIGIRLRMRAFLKSIDEASLRKLCELTMLTDVERDILVMVLSRRQDLNFIADSFNMSVSTLQRKMRQASLKMRFRLGIRHFYTEDEIRRRVEKALTTTREVFVAD